MGNEKGLEGMRLSAVVGPGTSKPKYGCLKEITVKVIDKRQPFDLGTLTLYSPDGSEANVVQFKNAIIIASNQICAAIEATSPDIKERE